jgi:hypothetical protein
MGTRSSVREISWLCDRGSGLSILFSSRPFLLSFFSVPVFPRGREHQGVLQVQGLGNEREAIYAFDALLADCQAFRLLTVREIAFDDTAISFPTTDTTGAASFGPLTHGALLYVARVISLVTMLASQQPTQKSVCRSASSTNLRMARSRGRACTLRRIPCARRQGLIGYLTLSQ